MVIGGVATYHVIVDMHSIYHRIGVWQTGKSHSPSNPFHFSECDENGGAPKL